jgi:hypothetical protein
MAGIAHVNVVAVAEPGLIGGQHDGRALRGVEIFVQRLVNVAAVAAQQQAKNEAQGRDLPGARRRGVPGIAR